MALNHGDLQKPEWMRSLTQGISLTLSSGLSCKTEPCLGLTGAMLRAPHVSGGARKLKLFNVSRSVSLDLATGGA